MVFPVADALKDRGVPFVFATGYDEAVIPPRHRHVPVWKKPIDADEVVQALLTLEVTRAPSGWRVGLYPRTADLPILRRCEVFASDQDEAVVGLRAV